MTLEDLRYYRSYYYGLNQRMLRMVGLWPYQEPKRQFFLNIIINFFFFTGLLHEKYQLYQQDINLEKIINHLQLSVPAICAFVCYNVGAINPEAITKIHDRVEYDIVSMSDEQEVMMLRQYSNNSRKTTWIIAFLLYAYYVLLILPAILPFAASFGETFNDTRVVFPIPTENLVDTKMQYYGLLFYQFLVAFVVVTITAATYTSYMAAIQHACLLLAIVILKIKAPFVEDSNDNRYLSSNEPNIGYDWIIDIVKSYVSAMEFVKLINILSETVYLVEVAGAMLILVLSFLYLSDMYLSEYKNIGEIAKCAIYSVTTIFLVYINCYVGQMLINHNTAVSRELRQIPFYKVSTKDQKLLLLVILRCTKPCVLMIGGIFVSSHEFFSALVQSSLSYTMVFHTMR